MKTLESRYGLKLEISEPADSKSFTATELLVDAALEKIYALFQQETDAPLATLARNKRAWTRSHLQTEQIEQVITLATRARQEFSVLVTIGIGGSDLSARVFHDMFNHPYHNLRAVTERDGAPEVYFTGDTFDPHRLIGLIEMLKGRNLLYKTLFNVISKSGRTGETIATLMIIRDILTQKAPPENKDYAWQRQVVATTGLTEESTLFGLHQESPFYGDILLPVPEGVGGRFSAFSPVGLFFLAMTAGAGETPQTRIRPPARPDRRGAGTGRAGRRGLRWPRAAPVPAARRGGRRFFPPGNRTVARRKEARCDRRRPRAARAAGVSLGGNQAAGRRLLRNAALCYHIRVSSLRAAWPPPESRVPFRAGAV